MFNFEKIKKIALFLPFIFVAQSAYSNDDAYLQALEEEADSVDVIQKEIKDAPSALPNESKSEQSVSKTSQKQLNKYQKRQGFLAKLAVELPATSRSFNRLNEDDQSAVVKRYYDSEEDMAVAIHLIFNLYFKHKN